MRSGGAGRGTGPLSGAAIRLVALFSIVALLAPIFPLAGAQASSDPWWGPTNRDRPTEGWAVRVPIVVENKFEYSLTWDSVVTFDLDLGTLLAQAGWTSTQQGTALRARGFTLDVDSIRVVQYAAGFTPGPVNGPTTEPTPHTFYPAPLDGERGRVNSATDAVGSIAFVLKAAQDSFDPGERRFYYVYANPLEYGKMQPAKFKPEERAPLDALLWGSSIGTTFYGYEPQQEQRSNRLVVMAATNQRTVVQVFERDFGRYVPSRSTFLTPNPLELAGFTLAKLYIPGGKAFKLVADHPIIVMGHGALTGTPAGMSEAQLYFPARSGSFSGTAFDVFGFESDSTAQSLMLSKTSAAPTTVTIAWATGSQTLTLSNSQPSKPTSLPFNQWSIITSSAPIQVALLEGAASTRAFPTVQVPALSGGPSGTSFYTEIPKDGGYLRVCPEARTGVRVIDLERPDLQVQPPGPRDTTPPWLISPRVGCETFEATSATPDSPLEAYAIGPEPRYPVENAPVPFRVIAGAQARDNEGLTRGMVGHYGGLNAVDFQVAGRVGIFGYFNDTRITVAEELKTGGSANRSLSVDADGFLTVAEPTGADRTGRYQLLATKPISVASIDDYPHQYARVVPGLAKAPSITVGAAEFRGPLVELRSADALYRVTGPATPITYRLDVINAGRWISGESLPDAISIVCDAPSEWEVDGCDREFNVASGDAERVEVTIVPPNVANVRADIFVEARSKIPGIVSRIKLTVLVDVRYGVGMWFDVENGRKTIDPAIGVDPGQPHDYRILIKNTGSTRDTFRLRVDPPKEGWSQELLDGGQPVTEVTLEPAESRVLIFRVTPPDLESAPQNFVTITAESTSSDLASAKDLVNTATRIRPKINIKLELAPTTRVAEPNETATFNMTVTNRGNDIFRIALKQDSVLPEGWVADLSVDEIDLGPSSNHTFPLRVTPPIGSRAGDIATVKIAAEIDAGDGGAKTPGDEVSAVVVVKRIHNVTAPPLLDGRAQPGETIRYVLPLSNNGNGDDTVELLPGADTVWNTRALDPSILMGLGDSADLPLEIDVPAGTPPGLHNITVTLRLSREANQPIVLPIQVAAVARADIQAVSRLDVAPSRAAPVRLTVENVGNLLSNFTLGADVPAGWNITFTPRAVLLRPGESAQVQALLNASAAAEDGSYPITLSASIGGDRAGDAPLAVQLARPQLSLASIETSGDLAPGELIIVAATVKNDGGIAAEDVKVALLVDGVEVDQVRLQRVPVGQSQIATLNWLATSRGNEVKVVIDPDGQHVLQTRDETDAVVNFSSTLGIPAPGALLAFAVLALAAVAVARRRRQ